MIGTEVVCDRPVEGEAAHQAQIVAVPGVLQDLDGALQPFHVQERADAIVACRTELVREEVVQKLRLRGRGLDVGPGVGVAGQVGDVRDRHQPPRQTVAADIGLLEGEADPVSLLDEVAEDPSAASRVLADPQPAQAFGEQAPGECANHRAAEAGTEHRVGAREALTREHECETREELVRGSIQVVVDREGVQVKAERAGCVAQVRQLGRFDSSVGPGRGAAHDHGPICSFEKLPPDGGRR